MTGWLANTLNIIGLVLISQKIAYGWLFGIAAECCWLIRGNDRKMPDLMFASLMYISIAVWSYWNWRLV